MRRSTVEDETRRDAPTVVRWRFDCLVEAGYEPKAASVLAERVDIDLHEAVRLVRQGCPPAMAVQILV